MTVTQRLVRLKLRETAQTLPNQVGKPTNNPTLRWIYQVFEGVHIVYHHTRKKTKIILTNMNDFNKQVVDILGVRFQKIYF